MDRQRVIDHLQIIATWGAVGKDPIYNGIEPRCCEDVEQWAMDALALLKEQELVEPKCTITSHGFHYDYCGDCGALLPVGDYGKANFCPACGKPVKWND